MYEAESPGPLDGLGFVIIGCYQLTGRRLASYGASPGTC